MTAAPARDLYPGKVIGFTILVNDKEDGSSRLFGFADEINAFQLNTLPHGVLVGRQGPGGGVVEQSPASWGVVKEMRRGAGVGEDAPDEPAGRTPHSSGGPLVSDLGCCLGSQVLARLLQVKVGLEIEPVLGGVAEVERQAQSSIGRNSPAVVDDIGDPVRRDADRAGELVLRQLVLGEELLLQDLARGDRGELGVSPGGLHQ